MPRWLYFPGLLDLHIFAIYAMLEKTLRISLDSGKPTSWVEASSMRGRGLGALTRQRIP